MNKSNENQTVNDKTCNRSIAWNAKKWKKAFYDGYDPDTRRLRREVWGNTLSIVENGGYTLENGMTVKLPNNGELDTEPTFYRNEFHPVFEPLSGSLQVTVVPDDCLDKAHEWVKEGLEVSVLNMASRRNPGGGVKGGAGAQEEYLFRCSNYYRSLYRFAEYAEQYGISRSPEQYPLDRDFGGIYSPNVTVFRGNEMKGYPLLKEPFQVNMIAVAGMNRPELIQVNDEYRIVPELSEGIKNKIRTILRIACQHGQRNLVLGALGCGAFRNPPKHTAELFREVMSESEFKGAFSNICFAVKSDHNSHGDTNYTAFYSVLNGYMIENN